MAFTAADLVFVCFTCSRQHKPNGNNRVVYFETDAAAEDHIAAFPKHFVVGCVDGYSHLRKSRQRLDVSD